MQHPAGSVGAGLYLSIPQPTPNPTRPLWFFFVLKAGFSSPKLNLALPQPGFFLFRPACESIRMPKPTKPDQSDSKPREQRRADPQHPAGLVGAGLYLSQPRPTPNPTRPLCFFFVLKAGFSAPKIKPGVTPTRFLPFPPRLRINSHANTTQTRSIGLPDGGPAWATPGTNNIP
jgi:hypothetical protein